MRLSTQPAQRQQVRLWHVALGSAILVAAGGIFLFMLTASNVSVLPGFSYRRTLTIDPSQVVGGQDLVRFPALVTLQADWLKSTSSGGYVEHPYGWDIAFTQSDGLTLLPFEVDEYDPAEGKLTAWVMLDTLSATVPTELFFYYGGTATSDPSDAAIWFQDFTAVWHLNDDLEDAGPGGWHLSELAIADAPGKLGSARRLGSTSYLDAGNISSVNDATSLTGSIWVKTDNTDHDGALMAKGDWNGSTPLLFWRDDAGNETKRLNTFSILVNGNGKNQRIEGGNNLANDTEWHYVAFTFEANQPQGLRLFIDGQEDANSPASTVGIQGINSSSKTFRLGRSSSNGSLVGTLDEARLSHQVRSRDWIATEYANQSQPDQFWEMGEEENLTSASMPVSWMGIEAAWTGSEVELSWATASEENNQRFEIERSIEGGAFEKAGVVSSQGDARTPQFYHFQDPRPAGFESPRIRYRVRQIDHDGQFSISPQVEVLLPGLERHGIKAYPNPFQDVLQIDLPLTNSQGSFDIMLRDINGRLLAQQSLPSVGGGETVTWYPPGQLIPGTYLLEVVSPDAQRYSQKLIHH